MHIQQKTGRWRSDVLSTCSDVLFWILIRIAHLARTPVDHLSNFMQAPLPPDVRARYGSHLAILVTQRIGDFAEELDALISSPILVAILDDVPLGDDGSLPSQVRQFAMTLILHHASAFDRRIARPVAKCARRQPPPQLQVR